MAKYNLFITDFLSEKNTTNFIFVVSLLFHLYFFLAILFFYGNRGFLGTIDGKLGNYDNHHYVVIAKNLVERGVYSRFVDPPYEIDSLRPPLYPAYFVPFWGAGEFSGILISIIVLQILLSYAAVLVYKISRYFLEYRYAFLSGLFFALNPSFAYRSSLIEPDPVVVFFILFSVYYLVSFFYNNGNKFEYLYYCYIFLGLLTLTKPIGMYIMPIFLIFSFVILFVKKININQIIKNLLISFVIFFSMIFPWFLRNKVIFNTWSFSSIGTYNFYSYYTVPVKSLDENEILFPEREPARNIARGEYYSEIVKLRISNNPIAYATNHLIGTVRNLFVSSLVGFYNNSHTKVLLFDYNPTNYVNVTKLFSEGKFLDIFIYSLSLNSLSFFLYKIILLFVYLSIFYNWWKFRKTNKKEFVLFSFFILLIICFPFAAGPFVDEKYTLPVVPLIIMMFFSFLQNIDINKRTYFTRFNYDDK